MSLDIGFFADFDVNVTYFKRVCNRFISYILTQMGKYDRLVPLGGGHGAGEWLVI
jgi:hypothetical protein